MGNLEKEDISSNNEVKVIRKERNDFSINSVISIVNFLLILAYCEQF